MNDEADKQEVMVHYRTHSWSTKFGEHKDLLLLGLMFASINFIFLFASIVASLTAIPVIGVPGFLVFFAVFGSIVTVGEVLAISQISRKFLCKDKMVLSALQEKALAGDAPLNIEEIHQLIDSSLKSNHQLVSDFYSKQVLALSMLSSEDSITKQSWMISSDCWASTEEYDKQWMKKQWIFYETRGVLTLSPAVLNFQSKKFTFECHPSHIKSIEIRKTPLWYNPARSKYLYVTIDESGWEHSFVLRPSVLGADLVWDGNQKVDEWARRIESVAGKSFNPPLPS